MVAPTHHRLAVGRNKALGTWQGRWPLELRRAGIGTVEVANVFLRERDIRTLKHQFQVSERRKAHRSGTNWTDLNWDLHRSTERVVEKDNTERLLKVGP